MAAKPELNDANHKLTVSVKFMATPALWRLVVAEAKKRKRRTTSEWIRETIEQALGLT